MSRLRSALLAGFIASSVWMFCALLFGLFTNDSKVAGEHILDDGGRTSVAWIGVAFLVGTFLITLLIANSISHSAQRRHDRKQIESLSDGRGRRGRGRDDLGADRAEGVYDDGVRRDDNLR